MKAIKLSAICLAVMALGACSKALEQSEYNSFLLKGADGKEVESGIYLPVGYTSRSSLPVVYFCDDLAVKYQETYCHMVDSMIENSIIGPVAMVIARDLSVITPDLFVDKLMPYVQKHWSVSCDRDGMVYFGSMKSADSGLLLSFEYPELISEYWLSSPVDVSVDMYGMLDAEIAYHFSWSAKDESQDYEEYSALMKAIRKRGGYVESASFEGLAGNTNLKEVFCESMEAHFGL